MHIQQRGSSWSIKLAFTLYKLFGYKFIYYIMYLVTFFYFIFATNVKKSLKKYYQELDITFSLFLYYEHLRMFAISMVDRFISKCDCDAYTFIYNNKKEIQAILEKKCILVSSHVGGWSSIVNSKVTTNPINIVMKEVLLEGIQNIENSIENSIENIKIIDIAQGAIPVSIEIAKAISNNEVIAMMADRAAHKKYKYRTKFFKKDAFFNQNPFKIAYRTKTPILIYFAIYKDLQTYQIEATILKIDYNLNQEEAIEKSLKEYVKVLEDILKQYPNQWFNFYDFWENK